MNCPLGDKYSLPELLMFILQVLVKLIKYPKCKHTHLCSINIYSLKTHYCCKYVRTMKNIHLQWEYITKGR